MIIRNILLVLFLGIFSYSNGDDNNNESKKNNKFQLLNSDGKSSIYYEINSKTFVPGALVTVRGFTNPFDSKKDWFVVLNGSSFFMPIVFFIEGNFYYYNVRLGKIICLNNFFYTTIVTNENNLGSFYKFPLLKKQKDNLIIDLVNLDEKDLIYPEDKSDFIINTKSKKFNTNVNITISNYAVKSLEIIDNITDIPVLIYKEVKEKSACEKNEVLREILLNYIQYLKNLDLLKIESQGDFKLIDYLDEITFMQTFIASYCNLIVDKKIPQIIEIKNEALYKIDLETCLNNFNQMYSDFLRFHKRNNSHLKWFDLFIENKMDSGF